MLIILVTIGMTWGAGNAIGHRVVDAIMGPRTIKHETVASEAAPASAAASPVANSMGSASCDTQSKAFQEVSLKPLCFVEIEEQRHIEKCFLNCRYYEQMNTIEVMCLCTLDSG